MAVRGAPGPILSQTQGRRREGGPTVQKRRVRAEIEIPRRSGDSRDYVQHGYAVLVNHTRKSAQPGMCGMCCVRGVCAVCSCREEGCCYTDAESSPYLGMMGVGECGWGGWGVAALVGGCGASDVAGLNLCGAARSRSDLHRASGVDASRPCASGQRDTPGSFAAAAATRPWFRNAAALIWQVSILITEMGSSLPSSPPT